jgi:hypothetical protein
VNSRGKIVILLFWLLAPQEASAQEPFSIILLPDTQKYTTPGLAGWPELFDIQTQWIVDNKDSLNIAFVLHEGDITNDNDDPGWANAKTSLDLLDGVVPYVLAVGNHDGLGSAPYDTTKFNQTFPVSKFENLPTFGDVFEPGKMDNCYHRFHAGSVDWLVFALEFGPRDMVLEWANQVAQNHPQHRLIVVTHTHVYSDDLHHQSGLGQNWVPTDYGRENNGDDMWEEFLKNHSNTAFVFNGHVLNDGQGRRVDTGVKGNLVYQMLCNYQMIANGGNSFLRIIRFYPAEDRLEASSYSPYLAQYNTDPQHRFEYYNLGIFDDRQPPTIDSVLVVDDNHVQVRFSEPVEEINSTTVTNYNISGDVTVLAAFLEMDPRTVSLTTSQLTECVTYVLTVNDVTDRASPPNVIEPGTEAMFMSEPALLIDDFDDGDFDGWTVVDRGTISAPSDWHGSDGRLAQSSNICGPDTAATENRQGSFAYWSDAAAFSWDDYVFSVHMQTTDDDGMGVLFRYQDEANYYKVDIDRQRNFRKLFRITDGVETTLAAVSGGYIQNADMVLRVEVVDNRYTVTLDSTDIFSGAVLDDGLQNGTVALYVWGNDGASFDNVKVVARESCPGPDGGYDDGYDGGFDAGTNAENFEDGGGAADAEAAISGGCGCHNGLYGSASTNPLSTGLLAVLLGLCRRMLKRRE